MEGKPRYPSPSVGAREDLPKCEEGLRGPSSTQLLAEVPIYVCVVPCDNRVEGSLSVSAGKGFKTLEDRFNDGKLRLPEFLVAPRSRRHG